MALGNGAVERDHSRQDMWRLVTRLASSRFVGIRQIRIGDTDPEHHLSYAVTA